MNVLVFKEILEGCLPALTHLVNSSLVQGRFCEEWKEALVKPLITKIALGMQNSNKRPVRNLCFISKVVDKVITRPVQPTLPGK